MKKLKRGQRNQNSNLTNYDYSMPQLLSQKF
jgi:hypothetical protein